MQISPTDTCVSPGQCNGVRLNYYIWLFFHTNIFYPVYSYGFHSKPPFPFEDFYEDYNN